MQTRPDNDVPHKDGSPSRSISPASLSGSNKMATAGNKPTETENETAEPQAADEPHLQQQHSATLPSQFPPELIDHIVDHLHNDRRSLIQCSRTSRVFSHATSYHLFRTVSVFTVPQCVRFQELVWSSLHPLCSTSHPSSSPAPHAAHHQITQAHVRSADFLPHSDRPDEHPHTRHACTSNCDVSAAGWNISKFVRRVEFRGLDPRTEEFVSEAVKLVRMLPRIREVVFGWWTKSTGLERIGRAFSTIPANSTHHGSLPDQQLSSASRNAFLETRGRQTPTNDPIRVHVELVDFESVHTFLNFLGSFGGRLRELSLSSVMFGNGGGLGEGDVPSRVFPGIESVYLDYEGG